MDNHSGTELGGGKPSVKVKVTVKPVGRVLGGREERVAHNYKTIYHRGLGCSVNVLPVLLVSLCFYVMSGKELSRDSLLSPVNHLVVYILWWKWI